MGFNLEEKMLLLTDLKNKKYPISVFFIIGNEFCERFSYYGMRTILALYLVDILKYSEGDATLIYHGFAMFCYFFPLVGAIIADSYLGKYKTIFYLSILYAVGNVVISTAATPFVSHQRLLSLVGLLLIAVGTGGIKPCVSAFGGDQFTLPQQAVQLAQFFSVFYFAINAGSLLSTYATPILRKNVHCFGETSCFSLAFGVPAVLMIISLLIFIAGKNLYTIRQPEGNIIVDVIKCISHAFFIRVKSSEKKEHWLDHAEDKFDQDLIRDVKAVFRLLVLYIPLPLFWALFDQQGSRWTFQATRMDGTLGWFTIKPDQMQVVNPFMILALIPLFDSVIYPLFAKCHMLVEPVQRLAVGGLLAALAFFISALLEVKLEATYPTLPQPGLAQLRVFNALPCELAVSSPLSSLNGSISSLDALQATDIPLTGSADFQLKYSASAGCGQWSGLTLTGNVSLKEKKAVSVVVTSASGSLYATQLPGFDFVEKTTNGEPNLRVLYNIMPLKSNLTLKQDDWSETIMMSKERVYTLPMDISHKGRFDIFLGDTPVSADVELGPAGVYTLVLTNINSTVVGRLVTVTPPNSVHMLWLLPQYIIITISEVMFSITGLQFSFTEAPESMKSLITAAWLLTISFGNLIVVIISEATLFKSQVWEFVLFAVLMVIDMLVFIVLACRYQSYTPKTPQDNKNNS